MVVGYILIVAWILPNGDIKTNALDYFTSNVLCYTKAVELEKQSGPGVGYVCLEDYVGKNDKS
tara:strand:+ start:487 stop:675 length:189 start_codon:yes stop_codon:yes gene_type:complete